MYVLSVNMWFQKIMRQFFFNIDSIVFGFISKLYDLLIDIARTSPLSQTDIIDMADRIYKLLAIFMVFKVTFSLIMYVVNPDDFSDKSKGISKLGTNCIISLALLILTPYVFNMGYSLQKIILEDNSIAALVFGDDKEKKGFLNNAGDSMAFTAMQPFFSPNLSLDDMEICAVLDKDCFDVMSEKTDKTLVKNYKLGIENLNLGLTFRQDLSIATDKENENFIMEYQYIFSTITAVIIILLLLTYCMDVAVRSIKLAFLQLVAPIPIISYVDPKSGKDGLFKKWYQMCFKTYLSLFIRIIALYFAVYIIGKVADMQLVDTVDGSTQSSKIIAVFIIIGALMFAKQLPKILEGLGVKLDGKFTLNPLKKFEENAIGAKRITGATRGALAGTAGMLTGAGIGRAISGAYSGLKSGKGWSETGKAEAEMNRKMRQAILNGSTFGGRMRSRISNSTGAIGSGEMIARQKDKIQTELKKYDDDIKSIEDGIAPTKRNIADQKRFADAIKSMETRAKEEIQNGNGGAVGAEYLRRKAEYERLKNSGKATANEIAIAEASMSSYLNDSGMKQYMTDAMSGVIDDKTFENMRKTAQQTGTSIGVTLSDNGSDVHGQFGATKGRIGDLERSIYDEEQKIESIKVDKAKLGDQMRNLEKQEQKAKANESVIK